MVEIVYEGFGPGGFSIMVEAVTDNKQRTTPVVKSTFEKNGGTIGNPGSVAYQFEQKGQVIVTKNGKTLDDIYMIAADIGAEDLEEVGEEVVIYTKPEDLGKVRDTLIAESMNVTEAALIRKPTVLTTISDKQVAERAVAFLEIIEELDDIQKVYANIDIPDELIS